MLAVTEQAASAIGGMLDSPEIPDDAGMRISSESAPSEDGTPQTELRLALVEAPQESDHVVEDAPVFLEPEVATLLDDKVLDADVEGERVQFHLREQTTS